ncbi:MAG: PilZ domain-containing protein [Novosphingobium sp.]
MKGLAHDDETQGAGQHGTGNGAEKRAAPRFTLLIRAAKLIVDDSAEFLCVIRDASATGLKIRMFTPLPPYRSLAVEMSNGERFPVELVWVQDEFAGFRFTREVDIERLLDEGHGAYPKRQVRLRVQLDALLHSGGEVVRVAFQDISQQGACIACDKWLLMNELVRIETNLLPPIYAKVRWRSHPRYGLLFEQTFKLDELARIAAPLQGGEHGGDILTPPDSSLPGSRYGEG